MVHIQETIIILSTLFTIGFSGIYSIENPDGSITINSSPDADGESANSIMMDFLKPSQFAFNAEVPNEIEKNKEQNQIPVSERAQVNLEFDKNFNIGTNLLAPHVEILQLVEVFLRLKGELAARFYDVITDNYDLIRSVYYTVISKVGSLHTFTLIGIKILRKILEFAVSLMANWQISLPPISVGVDAGSFGGFSSHPGPSPSIGISGLFG